MGMKNPSQVSCLLSLLRSVFETKRREMSSVISLVIHSFLLFGVIHGDPYGPQPQQVHLSLGATPSEMVVTWLTVDATNTSVVEYGSVKDNFRLDRNQTGSSELFVDGGSEKRRMYIHRVLLTKLTPGEGYAYHVGSDNFGWSEVFWFTTMREGNDWSVRFAVYGDLGNVNGVSIPRLQQEVQRNHFDAILHVGDMAYDLHTVSACYFPLSLRHEKGIGFLSL